MEEIIKEKGEVKKGIRAIWRHVKPFQGKLIILTFLGLISAAANGSVPYITGRFFDALINLSGSGVDALNAWREFPLWTTLLLAWIIAQLIANNIDWIMDRLRRVVQTKSHLKIQTDGFVHLFRLPLNYHKNTHINGDLLKIGQVSWRVSSILETVVSVAPQLLSVLIGVILAASISHFLAGVLAVGVLLYTILLVKILLPVAGIDSSMHRLWNQNWDDASSTVQQVESVKQAAAEEYEIKKTESNFLGKVYSAVHKLDNHWSNVGFFQRTIVFLTQLAVFIFSVRMIATGEITVGELVALNGYAAMFFGPFVSLGYSWQNIQNGITAAAHAEDIFKQPEENYSPVGAVSLKNLAGNVSFKNVSFAYASGQPNVLENMNIEVKAGQVVALVGESGVGKSTVVSLISGYYFPAQGEVLVDGVDTRKLDLNVLRRHIAVVPQEVALFNDTVMNNIRYGTFEATEAEVFRVAKEAHIDHFVSNFPKQYETIVGERGIKLSVGQKQRVAIARAMLRNPSILILDEPTSALDAGTEKIITEALEKLMQGRTTFIIAHRLSTVRKADMILVFEKGKIVESGTHAELAAREGGTYRRLYDYQIGLH